MVSTKIIKSISFQNTNIPLTKNERFTTTLSAAASPDSGLFRKKDDHQTNPVSVWND
jgi:hypothetical protein